MNSEAIETRYRKSRCVLWARVDDGILLRNYLTNVAIQLDLERRMVWELLDGAHTEAQIIEKLRSNKKFSLLNSEMDELVSTLALNAFIEKI